MKTIIIALLTLSSVSAHAALFSGSVVKVVDDTIQIQPDGTTETLERVWLSSLNENVANKIETLKPGAHINAWGPHNPKHVRALEFTRWDGLIYKLEQK